MIPHEWHSVRVGINCLHKLQAVYVAEHIHIFSMFIFTHAELRQLCIHCKLTTYTYFHYNICYSKMTYVSV